MSKIKVKQHDIKDCGAACLASIGNHYGVKVPIAQIRIFAQTDLQGTNVLGMIQAAEKMGFTAKGVKGGMDALTKIPFPTIAHVVLKNQLHHFVVIYKVTSKYIEVMDPAYGKIEKYTTEAFKDIWSGVLILLAPGEDFKNYDTTTSTFKRFWELVQPHKGILLQAIIGAMLYTVLGLSMSIYIQKITDYVLVDGNSNLLNLMSVGMICIIFIQAYIGSRKSILMMRTGQLMDAKLILGYYKHLMHLPQRFFDTMRIGEITSRISDAIKIRNFINDVAIDMVVNVFIVIFSFTLMFIYYWKLATIMLLIIPFYLSIYLLMNYLNKKVERKIMENAADLETQLVESINHVRTIKEFGIEDYSNIKTENRFIKLLFTGMKSAKNSIFVGTSTSLLASIFTVVLMWVGAAYVMERQITPGELFSFYALIGYFTSPVASLIGANKSIQNALIAADRLFEIMDLERESAENKMEFEKEDLGDIRFEKVNFSYGNRVQIFKDLEAVLPLNKMTAIVGESGSGKTTIFAILQNLYPISEGKVFIGGFSLDSIHYQSLRKLIGVVPQQISLFSGNIIDNIALGQSFPDIKRVVQLCQDLGISEFVEKLPNGYQTQLGENGAMLSGGQKQRIAIARALYKEPEILLLDEATSSLDSQAESLIQDVLNKYLSQNKTIITIAHRLSTIVSADQILVMKNGQIVEQGNYHSLLSNKQYFYEMSMKQNMLMH
ncbi:peptidase domain-containing ABC transporter [Aquirufa ecclesiirivi]|uniref:peptidase domain-containing ABC transporter n=1 Tax=Aquirufa ecclesiirivi TaxID=2715124 RepID=UPI003BB1BD22